MPSPQPDSEAEIENLMENYRVQVTQRGATPEMFVVAIQQMLVKARIETAKKILHKGWCIPEMEISVEDYIVELRQSSKEGGTK